jgi:hypothetical protein
MYDVCICMSVEVCVPEVSFYYFVKVSRMYQSFLFGFSACLYD